MQGAADLHRIEGGDILQPAPGVMGQGLAVQEPPAGQQGKQGNAIVRPAGNHKDLPARLHHLERGDPGKAGGEAVEDMVGGGQPSGGRKLHHRERTAARRAEHHPGGAKGGHGLQRGGGGNAQPLACPGGIGGGQRAGDLADLVGAHPVCPGIGGQQEGFGSDACHLQRHRAGQVVFACLALERGIAGELAGGIGLIGGNLSGLAVGGIKRGAPLGQRGGGEGGMGLAPLPRQVDGARALERAIGFDLMPDHAPRSGPVEDQLRAGIAQIHQAQPPDRGAGHPVIDTVYGRGRPIGPQREPGDPAIGPGPGIKVEAIRPGGDFQIAQVKTQQRVAERDPALHCQGHIAHHICPGRNPALLRCRARGGAAAGRRRDSGQKKEIGDNALQLARNAARRGVSAPLVTLRQLPRAPG